MQLKPNPRLAVQTTSPLPLRLRLAKEVQDQQIRVGDAAEVRGDTVVRPEVRGRVEEPALREPDGLGIGGFEARQSTNQST